MNSWIDFTRRSDPSDPRGVRILAKRLEREPVPDVLCFWTKNPFGVSRLYASLIRDLRRAGTLVLCQACINPGYAPLLEPAVEPRFWDLGPLIELLGGPLHVRMRFDPVVDSFTEDSMFEKHLEIAGRFSVRHTTVNFLVPEYKDVRRALQKILGRAPGRLSRAEKRVILDRYAARAGAAGIAVHVCAEIASLARQVPGVRRASCADPEWPRELGRDWTFVPRPSRPGCGCVYTADWGFYPRWKGGYRCPHGCAYCYAK
jgi:hypothetical protein